MKTLTIKLNAPLQSFGNEATFARRTTWKYPSKSAVIGMLSAAMGYRRNDSRIADLNTLKFAVRIDQPGQTMTDYQTVEWKLSTRKITYRDYLQDAIFVVAIGSEDDQLIDTLRTALRHPKFQLFFGRRANAPAGPLQLHLINHQNPVQVLKDFKWQASKWFRKKTKKESVSLEMIADAELLPDSKVRPELVKDRVISLDQQYRQIGFRAVSRTQVQLNNDKFKKQTVDTNHDVMNFL
ncbi:CRISPR-associated protein [Liquorilactobacillus sucicola DSM 21376 = JCM 15457]|uniref:Crispr-associated protein n=1 Tax=Liquorilactobacillus sucicola DSM 21376 = JCM 15457 TaxID=1423806 RepID=A0A023CYJ9_9LACO|nr:type I-E CRISPR-associated protein Cas5/CasD [Liquorilactobacillus sucicola]KRN07488.1 crispr-associated protein [Liquorilactobacillus sucicola DSM 21376 = JCM 15457]GAJ26884.1 CRISPR-associated protein [Liquorilactobacillus sucicola DSM 21376 = JCM 15457]